MKHSAPRMPEGKRLQASREMAAATDLYTTCRKCGQRHYGTLEELMKGCPDATEPTTTDSNASTAQGSDHHRGG